MAEAGAHNKELLQAREEWTEHGLIFPAAFGNPSAPDTFSHLFSKLDRKAGLGHWHPHGLRHSGASLMLAQGTPLHVVLDVLGHASIAYQGRVRALMEGDKRAATETTSVDAIDRNATNRAGNRVPSAQSRSAPSGSCRRRSKSPHMMDA
ncbi:tyrosine-type recombinase/integrase [Streptosporangium sp. NPDC004631]